MDGFKGKISLVRRRSIFSIVLNITPGLRNSVEKMWLLVGIIVKLIKFPMMLDRINIYDLTVDQVHSNIILHALIDINFL